MREKIGFGVRFFVDYAGLSTRNTEIYIVQTNGLYSAHLSPTFSLASRVCFKLDVF